MDRLYANKDDKDVSFFVGKEVEKTTFYGEKTLFVVGQQNYQDILQKASENECTHVYLGANKSFEHSVFGMLEVVRDLLYRTDLFVTLDVSLFVWNESYIRQGLKMFNVERFAINLSVPVPGVDSIVNMNIKIDDTGFNQNNNGVYIYQPNVKDKTFWSEYENDVIL